MFKKLILGLQLVATAIFVILAFLYFINGIEIRRIEASTIDNSVEYKDLPLSKFFNEEEIFLIKNGVDLKDKEFVNYIAYKESTFDYKAVNKESGAVGMFQLNPHWHEIPEGYLESPDIQLQWANNYAKERYKSWYNAYEFHKANGWW